MTILIKRDEPETRFGKKMNSLKWLLWLCFALSLVSCSSEETEIGTQADTYINLQVSAPSSRAESTSSSSAQDSDEVAANPQEEEKIYSIRVWAYVSGGTANDAPIGYTEKTSINETGSTSVSMKILRSFAEQNPDANLDLYILLNAESINKATVITGQSNKMVTRSQLANVKIESAYFGSTNDNKPTTTKVPDEGLPISRIVTNIAIKDYVKQTEAAAAASPVKVKLVRAVSKLHFYFARKANAGTEQVEVTRIEINGEFLPTESPAFPKASAYDPDEQSGGDIIGDYTGWTPTYGSNKIQLPEAVATADIKEVKDPLNLIKLSTETAQAYVDRLKDSLLVEKNRCYFRESNQKLTGTIYYKLDANSSEKSQKFEIDKEAYRNHDMLVYGYFLEGGALLVTPTVLDWNDGGTYTFKDAISIKTNVEKTNGDNIAFNNATYGPKISFTEFNTNGKSWVLQTDSPDYGFVYADQVKTDGSYDLKDVLTVIQGDGSATKVEAFYVVPKSELDYTVRNNYTCHVFMVAYNPNQKVIINAPADGSEGTAVTGTPTEMTFTQVK